MNTRLITNSEIRQRQEDIRHGAWQARHNMSIIGIRQLLGNTFIAMGVSIYGCMEKRREQSVIPPKRAIARGI